MKVFVVDLSRCNGCHNCQIACKDEHCGNDWAPYAKLQPDTGQFWCEVREHEAGQTPKVRVEYRPVFGAQTEAVRRYAPEALQERDDGLIVIDPAKASGRKDIADRFEGIFWNEELEIPQGCTGCAHLVDAGEVPHCVDLCATGALRFGDKEDFDIDFDGAECWGDPADAKVFYLNAPKLFVSGNVWDPEADEIIEGAQVKLTGSRLSLEQKTDGFGDFWFDGLEPGSYHLEIEAEDFGPVERDVELEDSLNVGDFPLARV